MKKPITIVVIAVIATILVTSAVDYSAIGAKPTSQLFAEGRATVNGEIFCPDGFTQVPGDVVMGFIFEEDERGNKGSISTSTTVVNPPGIFAILYNGDVESGEYLIKGVGEPNFHMGELCGLDPSVPDEVTIWGECGEDVVINFETEDGITGNAIGTVACV